MKQLFNFILDVICGICFMAGYVIEKIKQQICWYVLHKIFFADLPQVWQVADWGGNGVFFAFFALKKMQKTTISAQK